MSEIKPIAWVERSENGHDRMWSYSLEAWANRPANPEPLYDQSAIDRLVAEAIGFRMIADESTGMLEEAEYRIDCLTEERDAAVADARRWNELCRQVDLTMFQYSILDDAMAMGAGALELYIDEAIK